MLPFPLIDAYLEFKEYVTCYNVTRTYIDGRDEEIIGDDFVISAVIQPADDKDVQLDFDGQISSGMFIVHTFESLEFNDVTNKNESSNVQTIVKYSGEQWKVVGIKNWSSKTNGINKYVLSKYTEIE